MKAHETLTQQEIATATSAVFDLASGYPQIQVPDYMREVHAAETIIRKSLSFSPLWTPADQGITDEHLESSLAVLLNLRHESYHYLGVTFSGGVALDRALAAALAMSTDRGGDTDEAQVHVVTTSPSIDIMKLLLLERRLLDIHLVENRLGRIGGLDANAMITEIETIGGNGSRSRPIVLLTSPENPTGEVWSAGDLALIAEVCWRHGGVLILDHSFLQAGVHDADDVPPAWQVLPPDADWIALWDTGKTFGLNEDKLGFLVCGSESAGRYVKEALNVIQFGVSRRMKLLFAELFAEAVRNNYVQHLRNICRANLEAVAQVCGTGSMQMRATHAGSLVMVGLGPNRYSDEEIRLRLLRNGIGVIAGRVFFHTAWRPTNLIRLALARDPGYFAQGLSRLVEVVETTGVRDAGRLLRGPREEPMSAQLCE